MSLSALINPANGMQNIYCDTIDCNAADIKKLDVEDFTAEDCDVQQLRTVNITYSEFPNSRAFIFDRYIDTDGPQEMKCAITENNVLRISIIQCDAHFIGYTAGEGVCTLNFKDVEQNIRVKLLCEIIY